MTLHALATAGDVVGLGEALARGALVDERHEGWTALMCAAKSPRAGVDALAVLVARGADVEAERKANKHTEQRPLQLAIHAGDLLKVQYLVSVGARVAYRSAAGYDASIDAQFARGGPRIELVCYLLDHGAPVDGVSKYGETALNVASRELRMAIVRLLIDRGASEGELGWGPLARAVAVGSLAEVEAALRDGADRTQRDRWRRTPWMLSLEIDDRAKAARLFEAGVDRDDRGYADRSAVAVAALRGDSRLVEWLIDRGFGLEDRDAFGMTPLMHAVARGHIGVARRLLRRGADVDAGPDEEGLSRKVVSYARGPRMLAALLDAGGDLADTSEEMRRVLRRPRAARAPSITVKDYHAGAARRFGRENPERMVVPFWDFMIVQAIHAYTARVRFAAGASSPGEPVWCYSRFGQSITRLPDGSIVEIGGEHEDSYDADFCIYNDVVVHDGRGGFTVFGYPREVFPPTDFHTATYCQGAIYIVGGLGYAGERAPGPTPVYRLDCGTFAIERIAASGPDPGWVERHRARLDGDDLVVTGGHVLTREAGAEAWVKNERVVALDLGTRRWVERE